MVLMKIQHNTVIEHAYIVKKQNINCTLHIAFVIMLYYDMQYIYQGWDDIIDYSVNIDNSSDYPLQVCDIVMLLIPNDIILKHSSANTEQYERDRKPF